MPYIQRDANGKIEALWKEARPGAQEYLPLSHPDIESFLAAAGEGNAGSNAEVNDLQMVRVIEDVVDLLIRKNLIVLTELPPVVQHKLLQRRRMRERLFGGVSVIEEEGDQGIF